ncbi:MAG: hypothetical protein Q8Q39_01465 [bacterium]|nr:hypothetical protein [bacterium]
MKRKGDSMQLPCDKTLLSYLSITDLKKAILERRGVIRRHRDAKGDDRCWIDDWTVWVMLDDTSDPPTYLPSLERAMRLCRRFHLCRNANAADLVPADAITDPAHWDDDLATTDAVWLVEELARMQQAIRWHRDIGDRPRTVDDDRLLYAVLPEKLPADFRLPPPEDFLGENKAPGAGCPSFWRSHLNCPVEQHDLHRWGPCVAGADAEAI